MHAHVFNGSDIQVERFVKLVRARETPILEYLADVLQYVGWEVAPSGAREISALGEISDRLGSVCGSGDANQVYVAHRSIQHVEGARELKNALQTAEARRPAFRTSRGAQAVSRVIRSIPTDYLQFENWHRRPAFRSAGDSIIAAAVAFVLRQFQYRYVNVFDFLSEYSSGPARKIDLIICHLLDFDWALAKGRSTMTPVQEQINVMEQISILTGGRVHSYAPFDPFRQVAWNLGYTAQSPLAVVEKAITSRGHIGVKIYPPMGFAPYGNSLQPPSMWNKTWLPVELRRPDMGKLLDAALLSLYAWCQANNVPIMAHTAPTNGSSADFEALTAAKYWELVPAGQIVNFGHFGDTEVGAHKVGSHLVGADDYAALMGPPGSHGANFYADSGYLSNALANPQALQSALRVLFRATASKGSAALAQRLMYGSDWEMLIIEGGDMGRYLRNLEAVFSRLDIDPSLGALGKLSDRFFGINAVNHLQLHSGAVNSPRGRLNAFYGNRVPKPIWAQKVDNLALST
jgi:hypothetical protein